MKSPFDTQAINHSFTANISTREQCWVTQATEVIHFSTEWFEIVVFLQGCCSTVDVLQSIAFIPTYLINIHAFLSPNSIWVGKSFLDLQSVCGRRTVEWRGLLLSLTVASKQLREEKITIYFMVKAHLECLKFILHA